MSDNGYVVIDGIAYPVGTAPTTSAPAEPAAASPFETAGLAAVVAGKRDNRPAVIAAAASAAPDGKAMQWAREAARLHRVPLYTCDVDDTFRAGDGTDAVVARHGFAWAAKAGDPCKVSGCTGKVRA